MANSRLVSVRREWPDRMGGQACPLISQTGPQWPAWACALPYHSPQRVKPQTDQIFCLEYDTWIEWHHAGEAVVDSIFSCAD